MHLVGSLTAGAQQILTDGATTIKYVALESADEMRRATVNLAKGLLLLEVLVFSTSVAIGGRAGFYPSIPLFLRRILLGTFCIATIDLWLSDTYPLNMRTFIGFVEGLAGVIGGVASFDPSTVVEQGIDLYALLGRSLYDFGLWNIAETGLGVFFLAYVALFGYVLIAIQLFLTLLQGYFAIILGPLCLALGCNRWTAGILDGYVSYLAKWGLKYVILSIFVGLINEFTTAIIGVYEFAIESGTIPTSHVSAAVAVASLGFGLAIALLPGLLSREIAQGYNPGLAQLLKD